MFKKLLTSSLTSCSYFHPLSICLILKQQFVSKSGWIMSLVIIRPNNCVLTDDWTISTKWDFNNFWFDDAIITRKKTLCLLLDIYYKIYFYCWKQQTFRRKKYKYNLSVANNSSSGCSCCLLILVLLLD